MLAVCSQEQETPLRPFTSNVNQIVPVRRRPAVGDTPDPDTTTKCLHHGLGALGPGTPTDCGGTGFPSELRSAPTGYQIVFGMNGWETAEVTTVF